MSGDRGGGGGEGKGRRGKGDVSRSLKVVASHTHTHSHAEQHIDTRDGERVSESVEREVQSRDVRKGAFLSIVCLM